MADHRMRRLIGEVHNLIADPGVATSDAALLQSYVEGADDFAFAALVRRHGPMVLGVCRNLVQNHQDAEDAFQATFVLLARSAHIIRKGQSLRSEFPGVQFFFQPADIVTQILNFGTPAPVDIQITGMNQAANYAVGLKLANEIRHVPGAVDVHVQQAFDAPTLFMDINRTRAQYVGLQARDVAQNVLVTLSSSFQT